MLIILKIFEILSDLNIYKKNLFFSNELKEPRSFRRFLEKTRTSADLSVVCRGSLLYSIFLQPKPGVNSREDCR